MSNSRGFVSCEQEVCVILKLFCAIQAGLWILKEVDEGFGGLLRAYALIKDFVRFLFCMISKEVHEAFSAVADYFSNTPPSTRIWVKRLLGGADQC